MVSLQASKRWFRLIGLGLLALLLWQMDTGELATVLSWADFHFLAIAVFLNVPQITLKAFRWFWLLRSQRIRYGIWLATLSYFGSIFIGLVTPGRLGEFAKTLHVSRDCGIPMGRAFSSVLADRVFDLYVLLVVGGAALLSLMSWQTSEGLIGLVTLGLLLILPLVGLLHDGAFKWLETVSLRCGRVGQWLFAPHGWLLELRSGFRELALLSVLVAVVLSILAYAVFFGQSYLLARALGIKVGFIQVSYAVALGSLVTLIPISISGLGTREAAIVAYLGTAGVPAEMALAFSLLVFVTFYVAGGVMGAIAWWIKPVSWNMSPGISLAKYVRRSDS